MSYPIAFPPADLRDWSCFSLLVQLFSWQSPLAYRQASGTQPKHLLNCHQCIFFFCSQILEQLDSRNSCIEFAAIHLLHHLILLLPCCLLLSNLSSHFTIVQYPCAMATAFNHTRSDLLASQSLWAASFSFYRRCSHLAHSILPGRTEEMKLNEQRLQQDESYWKYIALDQTHKLSTALNQVCEKVVCSKIVLTKLWTKIFLL